MKHILISTFGVAVFALSVHTASAKAEGYANPDLLISAKQLKAADPTSVAAKLLDAPLLVIDVRSPEDYAKGHIPGAVNIAPDAVAAPTSPIAGALRPIDEVAGMLAGLGITPHHRVVFYDDRGGFHAARMFWLAEYLGHRNVSILDGGLTAWTAAGGAFETGMPDAKAAGRFVPASTPRRMATADWILERRTDKEVVVIDVRPSKAFVAGHIPWAINIPWSANLNRDGTMKSAKELRAHFDAHGVRLDRNVVIHCQTGLASSHSYVALRLLGQPRVRVYHRSWSEWGSDPSLPRAQAS